MKIIDLIQGSKEWHEFRRNHIGASDSSSVMHMNPWKCVLELWEEKVLGWETTLTDAMRRGQDMEMTARDHYQKLTGIKVVPVVIEDSSFPYISASLDGITDDFKRAVEIKCGRKSFQLAKNGIIPSYYFCQLQHQMKVTGLDSIDYFNFDGDNSILLTQKRDDEFIKEMLERYSEFWNYVVTKIPPRQHYETTFII